MRVAYVNQDPGISPSKKKGAAVHVDAMRRAFEGLGAQVLSIDVNDADSVTRALEDAALAGPIDLVYERYALGSGAAFGFARTTSTRYVLEVNSPLEQEAQRYRSGNESTSSVGAIPRQAMFAEADTVLAVSTEVAEYASANGATALNLRIQPNGVDLERFQPRREGDELRARLIPEGSFVLGFHGRVRPWHNLGMLVEATAGLIAEGLPLHLLLIGQGDYQSLVQEKLPASSYSIVPWTSHAEIGRYVACFDALVMTHSAQAPFYFSPLKLYEAMAAGVPPIVPGLGDLARILDHEQSALIFPADDDEALKAAIRRLHGDRVLREHISSCAQTEASKNSWDKIARSILEGVQG
jgi:glycosyltransferase involved in cell wall biosynthesis